MYIEKPPARDVRDIQDDARPRVQSVDLGPVSSDASPQVQSMDPVQRREFMDSIDQRPRRKRRRRRRSLSVSASGQDTDRDDDAVEVVNHEDDTGGAAIGEVEHVSFQDASPPCMVSTDGTVEWKTQDGFCFLCASDRPTSSDPRDMESDEGSDSDGDLYANRHDHMKAGTAVARRSHDYDTLLDMITNNIGRVDEACLVLSVQRFYDENLRRYVRSKPSWTAEMIKEHIRTHEVNPQWQAWTAASDIRALIAINMKSGVCIVGQDGVPQLDTKKCELHMRLLRSLEREMKNARDMISTGKT